MATGPLIRRQTIWTRVTHATWAVCLFFLLLSGLQIFNAHPALYLGRQSGFGFDNTVLEIGARDGATGPEGFVRLGGWEIPSTGVLGYAGGQAQAFPPALTIPSYRSLAHGRLVHFLFAWVLVATLAVWAVAALATGHWRQLVPTRADLRALPRDVADHARLRFRHGRDYGVLQKLAYGGVLFGLLPLMVLTGLAMSPGFNAIFPPILDLLGGRQTARTLHFAAMLGLAGFFVLHIAMILLAGPLNELRAIVTGWYRIDGEDQP
jgi:thiosulfate reductase cytochrome b subunit